MNFKGSKNSSILQCLAEVGFAVYHVTLCWLYYEIISGQRLTSINRSEWFASSQMSSFLNCNT